MSAPQQAAAATRGGEQGAGSTPSYRRSLPDGRLEISAPGRPQAVIVGTGTYDRTPDEWCRHERSYRAHIRLEDVGIAGATFGVVDGNTLDWIPPQDAGCVDWSKVDARVNFPKEVIMQFTLLRPLPGALLWVLDGDSSWRGRLYEVDAGAKAHYISASYWAGHQEHFQAVWANVMPVSWTQLRHFQEQGFVGPDY